jgi:hypothetical protein
MSVDGQRGSGRDQYTLATMDWRHRMVQVKEIPTAHLVMVCRRMFGEVVGQIVGSAAPMDNEVALGNPIPNPIERHVDGFGATLLYSSICDARCTGVGTGA